MRANRSLTDRYCREVLPRVSRTFALNIRVLEGSLGTAVRTAYLLCRIADTLEDAWRDQADGASARFGAFLDAVAGSAAAAHDLASRAGAIAAQPTEAAALELVRHAPTVFAALEGLPGEDREALRRGTRTLARGMLEFVAREPARAGRAYLEDEGELARYCYAVAGCVGEMLTRLFLARAPRARAARRLETLAPVFGEGLQLTNILLDLAEDLRRRRCYLPQAWLDDQGVGVEALTGAAAAEEVRTLTARLESRALRALDAACDYTTSIPRAHWRYRLFCAWPLLWAAASLGAARGAPRFVAEGWRPRVSRRQVTRLALSASARVFSNGTLAALYRRTRPADR